MTDSYIGQILQGGWNFAPKGTATCAGQAMSISQNTALFSLLGTTYGGNGQTTFNLPDLRGRAAVNNGQGPGLSDYVLGQAAGTENATLTTGNMPSHTHVFTGTGSTMQASTTKATTQVPAAGSFLAHSQDSSGKGSIPDIYIPSSASNVNLGGLNVAGTNALTGNNLPFSILGPYLAIQVVICLVGIFPSRN